MGDKEATFGSVLRALRVSKKLSLRQLAEYAGIDFTYLSKVETGRFPPPSEDVIEKLASILGADHDEWLRLARKVDTDIHDFIVNTPEAPSFLRAWKDQGIKEARKILDEEIRKRNGDAKEP